MSRRAASAPARMISADEAAALVRSDTWIDFAVNLATPDQFDAALARRTAGLRNVKIRCGLTPRPPLALASDPEGERYHGFSWHVGGHERRLTDVGRCHYVPLHLGEVPDYYRRFIEPPDVAVFKTGPMDADGYFNLGPSNLWCRAVAERARTVIVEVSPGIPHALGVENALHVDEVDYIIEGDPGAPPELSSAPPGEIDRAVARHIAAEIDEGACLQIGIGGMPNAVCTMLLESDFRDLGIHTEMLTDGLAELYRAGRITGARKRLDVGKITYTFALGSKRLYETIHRNPDLHCCAVDYTNAPHIIMQNDQVVSINNTTQIDLQGQAASESDGHRQISGTGGQAQFVRGAYASRDGKSFICLASTYDKRGERRSRIVFELTPGNIVTTPRSDVMYVVTEYGAVNLKGKSVPERALALIGIAHPDFRESLERQAHEHRLLPRGVSF